MSSARGDADLDRLKLRQIIADIDQKQADTARKQREVRVAPWALALTGAAAGAGLFAGGGAFSKPLMQ